MWLSVYRRRIDALIDHWAGIGLIDTAVAARLHADIMPKHERHRLPVIMAMLGAVLLSAAILSFIAANWNDMARLLRFAIIIIAMCAAYGLSYVLIKRNLAAFAECSLLLGLVLFGAGINRVAQMYHITAQYADGILIWALGAFLLAVLLPSRAALIGAILLGAGWTILESFTRDSVHWGFLVLWFALSFVTHRRPWRFERHLLVIAIYGWFLSNLAGLGALLNWFAPDYAGVSALTGLWGFLIAAIFAARAYAIAPALRIYGLLVFLSAFFMLPVLFFNAGTHEEFPVAMSLPAPWTVMAFALTAVLAIGATAWENFKTSELAAALGLAALVLLHPLAGDVSHIVIGCFFVIVYFLIAIWLIAYGLKTADRGIVNLGFIAFGAEVLYVYFETVGSLMDNAAFFAVGGILLIALSILLERLRRRLMVKGNGAAA